MRTTSSFEIFPNQPSERELARARWLRGEGRLIEAEVAYRNVLANQPALRTGWTECFELLRSSGRVNDALALATDAEAIFTSEAFPLTLKGAALIELGKYQLALQALEVAVERDPDLAMTWHELGYAAYRLGDGNRALLALDRAFALEPHTETLVLRGKILREAGEYYAAEVAFEGALHSATHREQETNIRNEILITRRRGAFAPSWAQRLTQAEEWFARYGAIVIATAERPTPPRVEELVEGFLELARDLGWQFGQIVAAGPSPAARSLAAGLSARLDASPDLDPDRVPLLFTEDPSEHDESWRRARDLIGSTGRGMSMTLHHPIDVPSEVDLVGALTSGGTVLPLAPDAATAVVMGEHPAARVASRILRLAEPLREVADG
jgi:tetratricopeptide (TPR) repeat protein